MLVTLATVWAGVAALMGSKVGRLLGEVSDARRVIEQVLDRHSLPGLRAVVDVVQIESLCSMSPPDSRIRIPIAVNCLVIEPMRNRDSGAFASFVASSAMPRPFT